MQQLKSALDREQIELRISALQESIKEIKERNHRPHGGVKKLITAKNRERRQLEKLLQTLNSMA